MLAHPAASSISTRCCARDADMLYCWLRPTMRVTLAAVDMSPRIPTVKITMATTTSTMVKPPSDRLRALSLMEDPPQRRDDDGVREAALGNDDGGAGVFRAETT